MGEYNRVVFGKNLRYLRNKYGYNQEELAKRLGVSQNTVSNWESGNREPDSIELFLKICDLFGGISLDELINGKIEKSSENFASVEDAIKFILEQPLVASFGGYDLDKMTDDEILEFAEDVSRMIEMLGKKYNK